jgi:hypothetical protein
LRYDESLEGILIPMPLFQSWVDEFRHSRTDEDIQLASTLEETENEGTCKRMNMTKGAFETLSGTPLHEQKQENAELPECRVDGGIEHFSSNVSQEQHFVDEQKRKQSTDLVDCCDLGWTRIRRPEAISYTNWDDC